MQVVFKLKLNVEGRIDRYKARLVAKGFTQQEGISFTETFAPVAKITNVKVLISIVISNDWHLSQLDINNAFLYGELEETVYMGIRLGLHTPTSNLWDKPVCKLNKALYGLK